MKAMPKLPGIWSVAILVSVPMIVTAQVSSPAMVFHFDEDLNNTQFPERRVSTMGGHHYTFNLGEDGDPDGNGVSNPDNKNIKHEYTPRAGQPAGDDVLHHYSEAGIDGIYGWGFWFIAKEWQHAEAEINNEGDDPAIRTAREAYTFDASNSSLYTTIQFDMRLGTETAQTGGINISVSAPGPDGTSSGDLLTLDALDPLPSTNWATYQLSFFDFGDLDVTKMYWLNMVSTTGAGDEIDHYFDNVMIVPPSPGPTASWSADFEGGTNTNSSGGETVVLAGFGADGPTRNENVSQPEDSLAVGVVSTGARRGANALSVTGSLTNIGTERSWVEVITNVGPTGGETIDVSSFGSLYLRARQTAGNNLMWQVRLDDIYHGQALTGSVAPVFDTSYFEVYLDLDIFSGVDLTRVKAVTLFAEGGPNTQTPTLNVGLEIDELSFSTDPGSNAIGNWNLY